MNKWQEKMTKPISNDDCLWFVMAQDKCVSLADLEGSTGHQTSRSLAEKGLCCRCKLSGGRGMVAWEGSSFPAPHKHHSFGPVEKARQQHMVDQKHRNYVHICSEVRYTHIYFPRLLKKCQNWHLQIAGAIYDILSFSQWPAESHRCESHELPLFPPSGSWRSSRSNRNQPPCIVDSVTKSKFKLFTHWKEGFFCKTGNPQSYFHNNTLNPKV